MKTENFRNSTAGSLYIILGLTLAGEFPPPFCAYMLV